MKHAYNVESLQTLLLITVDNIEILKKTTLR
jgi:hypothetical protein